MKMISKYLAIPVLLTIIPCTALSRIYKCKADGETIFSYEPCGQDAQEIQVNPNSIGGAVSLSTEAESVNPDQKNKKHDEPLKKPGSSNP